MTDVVESSLVFIGGGTMANAIIRGGLGSGRLIASRITVVEPDDAKRALLAELGTRTHATAARAIEAAEDDAVVILAIKPQALASLSAELGATIGTRLVITMLAGTPSAIVAQCLGNACRVVRVMPNLPASIRSGTTAVAPAPSATEADTKLAMRLFAAVGSCVERMDESLMDAFTAVAGSGPAYLFYLAEAMVAAACSFGIEPHTAERIVRATLAGSATLLHGSELSAAQLRAAVTSKGGTTNAAIESLDHAGARLMLTNAIDAARRRGEELSRLASAAS